MAWKKGFTFPGCPEAMSFSHIIVSEIAPGTISSYFPHTVEWNASECICSKIQAHLGLWERLCTVPPATICVLRNPGAAWLQCVPRKRECEPGARAHGPVLGKAWESHFVLSLHFQNLVLKFPGTRALEKLEKAPNSQGLGVFVLRVLGTSGE